MSLSIWQSGVVPTNQTYRLSAAFGDWWRAAGQPDTLIASAGGAYDDPCICLMSLAGVTASSGRAGAIALGVRTLRMSDDGRITGVIVKYQIADLGSSAGYRSGVASALAAQRVSDTPPSGYGRTWWQVEPAARTGVPVRRLAWTDAGRTVHYVAGAGSTRAVGQAVQTGVADAVVTPALFAAAEFLAADWVTVGGDELHQDLSGARLEIDLRTLDDDQGYGDPLAGNITWHFWRAGQYQPGPPVSPGDPPALPTPPPDTGAGFVYRRQNGAEVLIPGKTCDGALWVPP